MRTRRPKKAVVVYAGEPATSDRPARDLVQSLLGLGVQVEYVGRERTACRIVDAVVAERADALELCLSGGPRGILLLQEVLRQLIAVGRRNVSIVVHRTRL